MNIAGGRYAARGHILPETPDLIRAAPRARFSARFNLTFRLPFVQRHADRTSSPWLILCRHFSRDK